MLSRHFRLAGLVLVKEWTNLRRALQYKVNLLKSSLCWGLVHVYIIIKHTILTTKSAVYRLKNHVFDYVGNSMVEQLERWTDTLTASWICSW